MIKRDELIERLKTYASSSQVIVEPDSDNYTNGTIPLDTLPAAWWNYFLNKLTYLEADTAVTVNDIYQELMSFIEDPESGITPSPEAHDQVKAVVKKMIAAACDATEEELNVLLQEHVEATDVHGATSDATPDRIVMRNSRGQAQVSDPTVEADVANKHFVEQTVDQAMQSTYRFIGYVSAEPPETARDKELWYNSESIDTSFPWDVQVWADGSWQSTDPYNPELFDLWSNRNDDSGYYWFGDEWNLIDQNIDLSPYRTAAAQDVIDDAQDEALQAHINKTTGVHGATSSATANKIAIRDGSGRLQVANPANNLDAANKAYVDSKVTTDSIPVGFIYVQYPNQTDPNTLFGGTWQNISSQYAGRFFRAEGGDAVAFGSDQAEGLPNITGGILPATDSTTVFKMMYGTGALVGTPGTSTALEAGRAAVNKGNGNIEFNASYSNNIYGASTHVTPMNSTIRIWKRTA